MAVSLCNHSLLAPSPHPLSISLKPSKTLNIINTPSSLSITLGSFHFKPSFSKPTVGFSSPIISTNKFSNSLSFKAYVSPPPSTNDRDENQLNEVNEFEDETDQKNASSLLSLLRIYKEAILIGDKKTIADVEAKISGIENENNILVQKVSTLSAEITSGKEKYIRLQADFDNFRKRSEKERINIRSDAQGEVIESLLPMVDNFERAKDQIKPETEMEKKIDTSYQGIYKQFVEIMRSLRVAVVATVGKPFDPLLHEAIAREESQEYKEGIITQEFRRGFLLGDRLLRPAMVKVSAGPGSKKASVGTEQPAATAGLDER
ncbi:hypothetical protein K2173_028554 [Erythroxylum novogranatense]|uniref:GrpE protein homolog n=1 Tax=Erythroxylum novogranatense TaxID=1862640 RepID=A0AAV8U267_9ROSI|nr:hypothetical protein K2173_028554 [Erythroxylum novogranatense]